MSDYWIWLIGAGVIAIAGAYLSALHLSLKEYTRAELEILLDRKNKVDKLEWLREHEDYLILSAGIWRRIFTIALPLVVLLGIEFGTGGNADNPVGMDSAVEGTHTFAMLMGALVVFVWLWFVDIGFAWAISEHIATPVVSGAIFWLPMLRFISRPLVAPLLWLGEGIRRIAGVKEKDDLEDELRQVVEEGEKVGNIGEIERGMIEAVVDFRTATVDQIMTPRIDVEGVGYSDDVESFKEFIIEAGHSRYPVYIDDLDHIEGILYVKDLLPYVGRKSDDFKLKAHLREAMLVPESRRIRDLLEDFKLKQVHMAIVLDEYGGTAGIVTIEDIVEEIVGEIHDEHEPDNEAEPTLAKQADGSVIVDARFYIDDLNDELGLSLPEDNDFDTVGGWVFATLGRIPVNDEVFILNNIEVTILEAEKTHIIKLQLRILAEDEITSSEAASH